MRGVVAGGVSGAVTAGGGALELLGPPGVRPPAPGAERKTEKRKIKNKISKIWPWLIVRF